MQTLSRVYGACLGQRIGQRVDALHVQVVGGLVQQQGVRCGCEACKPLSRVYGARLGQRIGQRVDALHVQVVAGLVQQQGVRCGCEACKP